MYKNFYFRKQEQKGIGTLEHAIAINDEGPSQNPAPVDTAARFTLPSQEIHTVIPGMERKEAKRLCSDQIDEFMTKAAEDVL